MLIINHMSTSADFTKINLYCQAEETEPGIGVRVSFATKKPEISRKCKYRGCIRTYTSYMSNTKCSRKSDY